MIQVELPDGRVIEVETDDRDTALRAAGKYLEQEKGVQPEKRAAPVTSDELKAEVSGNPFRWNPESQVDMLKLLGLGAHEGALSLAEIPYDILNNLPRLVDLLPGEQNVGTISEEVADIPFLANLFPGTDPLLEGRRASDIMQPRNFWEKAAVRTGQELGASAAPAAGVLARGAQLAERGLGAAQMGLLDRAFVAPFMQSPAAATAAEAAAATGAGLGATAATKLTGRPEADFWGALAGGMAPTLLLSSVGRVKRAAEMLRPQAVGEQEAGRRLLEEATDPSVLAESRVSDALDEAPFGMNLTVGQATNDPGLKNLEYSRLTGPNAPKYAGLLDAQQNTLRGVIDTVTPATPDDAALRTLLDQMSAAELLRLVEGPNAVLPEASAMQMLGEMDLEDAQSLITRLSRAAGASPSKEMASRTAATRALSGDVSDSIINQYRKPRDELYGAVPNDVEVPMGRAREVAQEVAGEAGRAAAPPASVQRIAKAGVEEGAEEAADTIAFRRARDDLKALGDEARAARRAGRPNEARNLERVRGGVRDDIAEAAKANAALQAANANEAVVFAPKFREGVPSQVRAGVIPEHEYLSRALRDPQETDRLAVTIRGDEAAQQAVRDWFFADLAKNVTESKPLTTKQFDAWFKRQEQILGTKKTASGSRFPEIREELLKLRADLAGGEAAATRAQNTIAKASNDYAAAQKQIDAASAVAEKTRDPAVKQYLRGETATESVSAVLRGPKSRENLAKLMNLTEGDTAAREGLKRGFAEFLTKSVVSRGDRHLNPGASADFLKRYGDHIGIIYRDAPKHGEDIRKMLESVAVLSRTAAARPRGTTGTAISMRPEVGGVPLTSIFSRVFAAESDRTSYRFVVSETLAQVFTRLQARLNKPVVEWVLDEALMSPKLAATLAGKYTEHLDRQAVRELKAVLARFGGRGARAAIADEENE